MSTYMMRDRRIRLDDSWDVVIAGGGPSGCTAAVASAREGAKTLLIEATGCLGGMGTAGLVPAWCPFTDGEKMLYRGLAEKVFLESKKGVPHEAPDKLDWVAINPEHLKRVYDDLVTGAGVKVLFHTMVAHVEMKQDGVVDAVICANKAGLTAYKAKVYVDCTGDGDVAAWAGAEHTKGDEKSGEMQPATHCFILTNVDTSEYVRGPQFHSANPQSPIWDILKSGKYPLIADDQSCQSLIGPGTVGFNSGHLWDVDNTDPESITAAMMKGRRVAEEFRKALAEFHPKAFGGSFLTATASLMGIRETRRITGDYVLTVEDYVARRSFQDEIARNCYFVDIHTAKGEIEKVRDERRNIVETRFERYAKGESHGIPYRCLTPKGLKNLLVAGRCISSDRLVQGSVRVMPVCLTTGEAAGLAAALAAHAESRDVHAVDTRHLRQRLKQEGAYLPDSNVNL